MMSKDRKERPRRGEEEEEGEVDATGVTSMLLLLRVTGDGGKVSETRRKVAEEQQKLAHVEQHGGERGKSRRVASLLQFINEQ